mmetsp:Transcript_5201/g.7670  ORF Transcript_5201/g.7670 Transcript_5201/m.7670 type:complete len:81 (+) Transcript_5201:1450-1692(+)
MMRFRNVLLLNYEVIGIVLYLLAITTRIFGKKSSISTSRDIFSYSTDPNRDCFHEILCTLQGKNGIISWDRRLWCQKMML